MERRDVARPSNVNKVLFNNGLDDSNNNTYGDTNQGIHEGAMEPNWWEFRFKDFQPERRGYHSTFIHGQK